MPAWLIFSSARPLEDLERRAGVTGPCGKVKGDDEVNPTLRPQNERVGEVEGQAAVHNMDLFTLHIQRLVDTIELIGV